MTPISMTYFILGLLTLYWPLQTVLFKRNVSGAQWMMTATLIVMALSIILYSSLFNNFLRGEYLLVMLFMIVSLATLPMTQASMALLTEGTHVPRSTRVLVFLSLLVFALMVMSQLIGGSDMYLLWIERGIDGYGARFFSGSWRYDFIVAVHFYLYWLMLMGQMVYVIVYGMRGLHRFRRRMSEYYTTERYRSSNLGRLYLCVVVNALAILSSYVFFPFNVERPLWAVVLMCAVECVAMCFIGYYADRMSFVAENLDEAIRQSARRPHGDIAQMGREMCRYVETEGYRNPDLSVFELSKRFRMSQDDVVDAIHTLHGVTFAEYVDALRIETAAKLVRDGEFDYNPSDPDSLSRLAHQCGYLSTEAMHAAFKKLGIQ